MSEGKFEKQDVVRCIFVAVVTRNTAWLLETVEHVRDYWDPAYSTDNKFWSLWQNEVINFQWRKEIEILEV